MATNTDTGGRLFVIASFIEAHCWFVPRNPGADESLQARAYLSECAGKGLAVALGGHRLGAEVGMLLGIGHDAAGDELLQLLAREGLDAAHVHRLGEHSGKGCGLVDAQGAAAIAIHAGANALLGEPQLKACAAQLRQAAVVYAQLEAPLPLVARALRAARAAGAATVLNPSPWHEEDALDTALDAASVVIVNRSEAPLLLGRLARARDDLGLDGLPQPLLEALWRRWPGQWLVITLGGQGCAAYSRDGQALRLPAHPLRAVQPIGAGDAFSAGLCTALARGRGMEEALRQANACGGLAASRPGILQALPFAADLAALLLRGRI